MSKLRPITDALGRKQTAAPREVNTRFHAATSTGRYFSPSFVDKRPADIHRTRKTRHKAGFFQIRETYCKQLGGLQIAGRQFAALGDDFVTDALTLRQCVHASALYRADVYENVFIAIFRLDKSKSLAGIKKLNSSNSHFWPP